MTLKAVSPSQFQPYGTSRNYNGVYNGYMLGPKILKQPSSKRFSHIPEAEKKIPWKTLGKVVAVVVGVIVAIALIDGLSRIKIKKDPKIPEEPCNPIITAEKVTIAGNCTMEEIDKAYDTLKDRLIEESKNQKKLEIAQGNKADIKIPCTPKIGPYAKVEFIGDCSADEKIAALNESSRLTKESIKQLKDEVAKVIKEQERIFNEVKEKLQQEIDEYKRQVEESRRREKNPTPEEQEEDERILVEEIRRNHSLQDDPYMERFLREKYPKYSAALPPITTDCNKTCQETARKLLDVTQTAEWPEIKKKCHQLSLETHPDKDPENSNANDQFISIRAACQILRPRSHTIYY